MVASAMRDSLGIDVRPLPAGDAAHPPRTVRRHSSRREPLGGHPVRRGCESGARRLPAPPSRSDRTGARLLPRRRLSRWCQEPRGQTARLPAREPRVAVRQRELRASSRFVRGVVGRRPSGCRLGSDPRPRARDRAGGGVRRRQLGRWPSRVVRRADRSDDRGSRVAVRLLRHGRGWAAAHVTARVGRSRRTAALRRAWRQRHLRAG